MRMLYCGVSSKYIHTMPAGWFLAEYLKSKGMAVVECYRNVNEPLESVEQEILAYNPDVLLVSVYIFNAVFVKKLAERIKEALPCCTIIAGGPEADAEFPCDHIVRGDGEKALYELLSNGGPRVIDGGAVDLNEIPSPYTPRRLENSRNKLIYYESSRGCPFRCAYCMAGLSKEVRYFPIERVERDLINIVESGARIIKFTDRTFNDDADRADAIIRFIMRRFSHSGARFHFEVRGELLAESTIGLLEELPAGLVQLEAGVQSTNKASLDAVNRGFDKEVFFEKVSRIIRSGNVRVHLDLIAGLPHETLESFASAVNDIVSLRPHMLQLGFLKILKGTPIRESRFAEFSPSPPYEVISTPTMSEDELMTLKGAARVIDKVYNSGRFAITLERLYAEIGSPFAVFSELSSYLNRIPRAELRHPEALYKAILEFMGGGGQAKELLRLDYFASHKCRRAPVFLRRQYSPEFKRFLSSTAATSDCLYDECEPDGIAATVKFDYTARHPVTGRYSFEYCPR